jgi:hypothetical protein
MPSFTYTSSSEEYKATFEKYVELGHKTVPEALDHQGQQLAFDLYKLTMSFTPGKDFIMAIPPRVGWRIKRPPGWAVFTETEVMKRKKGPKRWREKVMKNGMIKLVAVKPTTLLLKPGEMNKRASHAGVTARSWLPRVWRDSRSQGWHLYKIKNPLGRVEFTDANGVYSVTLINTYPGMPGMDARFGIVYKALQMREADMKVYIERKLDEAAKESGMG